MTKRMLIDATHAEETRVAVVDGNRLVEFDYESKLRKQLKGSIFLAKVTRVEPSLQAAFVNFGGNRHGFLPFSEIHPDYFRIPIADREALLAEQKEALAAAQAAEEAAIAEEEAQLAREEAIARGEIPADEEPAEVQENAEDETSGEDSGDDTESAEDSGDEEHGEESAEEYDSGDEDSSEETGEDESGDEETADADESAAEDLDYDQDEQVSTGEDEAVDTAGDSEETAEDGQPAEDRKQRSRGRRGRGRNRRGPKLVYKAVGDFDVETCEIKAIHEGEDGVPTFALDLAYKLKDHLETLENVVRVKLWGRDNDVDGEPQMRSIWIAFREDNPVEEEQPVDEADSDSEAEVQEEGREGGRRRDRSRGRDRGRFRGRGRNGRPGAGGRTRQAFHNRQVEVLGGDGVDSDQPYRLNMHRNYKIQEVIKRGQIMLIQVQKEERGNKGAAVTTYLSLPGRYCVLMPNSPRGGGVSRKIASIAERKRMREILAELPMPEGMSVILRTAGVSREHEEIKRDLDYLTRLWDNIRDLTLESSAPAIIYEESNLVKRAVRDIYAADVEDIWVAGEKAYQEASTFMKMLMPSHVDRVKQYNDEKLPLFHRYQVENQIADMGEPQVTLKSGGYLVIHPTEALVSVDVNSGRATKERHIEETALKTNLEAADEVARQLRLRDLGGLVVIDFIDMEDSRNNAKVERRLKEALSNDRARIQIGRISSFGLMELSRQRLNPSVTEAQFQKCPHCEGVGVIRTVDSAAILALRSLEEEGIRSRSSEVILTVPNTVAIYILNEKRAILADIERRYGFRVLINVDDELEPRGFKVEAVKETAEVESRAARIDSDLYEESTSSPEEEDDVNGNVREAESEDVDGNSARPARRERGGRGRSRSERSEGRSESRSEGRSEARGEGRSRGRGRGRNRAVEGEADTNVEAPSPVSAAPEAPVETADVSIAPKAEPKFQAKRFTARKAQPDAASVPAESSSAAPSAGEQVVVSAPSNDEGGQESGEKKKGWWNRLIEK